ncbi:MAG: histidinol-phosphate transaminase [Vicinamibacterales bacterium]
MTTIQGMPNLGPGLRLHLNENTGGCSPQVLAAIRGVTAEDVSTYADYEGAVRDTAARLGVDPDWVVLTNGLDEGLLLAAIAYLLPKAPPALVELGAPPLAPSGQAEQILMLPTFEPYVINAKALGARTVAIPCGPNFEYPVDAVLAAVGPNTRLVCINTPHNPSGVPVAGADIRRVVEAAAHAVVFIDEAYHDFHGVNYLHLTREYPNVLVGRTFSKAYGLAGIRIGLVIGRPALLEPIRFVMPLFNLNSVAVAALRAALADTAFMPWYVAQARQSKALLYAALDRLGLRYWKSESNFVLVDGGARAQELIAGMIAGGVLVRDRGREHNCANCFRVTTGVVEHTTTAITVLEGLCAKR